VTNPMQPTPVDNAYYPDNDENADVLDREEGQIVANGNSHEPGPSFVANDHPTDRLTDMPAWLQAFAAQESNDQVPQDEPVESKPDDLASRADSSPVLPDWLRDEPEHAPEDAVAVASQPLDNDVEIYTDGESNPDGFISEDDLPDWLRAFSNESVVSSPGTPDGSRVVTAMSAAPVHSTMVKVPPVENIWLTSLERNALGPGGSLFALLASNVASDAGVSHQSYSAYGTEPAETSTFEDQTPVTDSKPEQSVDRANSQPEQPAQQSSSMRILLLTLLVVMLVIAISVWQFS
jgi:hypothetical protein